MRKLKKSVIFTLGVIAGAILALLLNVAFEKIQNYNEKYDIEYNRCVETYPASTHYDQQNSCVDNIAKILK